MDLSQGSRRLIRRYFHGIGIPNPSGFLFLVYHKLKNKDEHSLNFSMLLKLLQNIILLVSNKYDTPLHQFSLFY